MTEKMPAIANAIFIDFVRIVTSELIRYPMRNTREDTESKNRREKKPNLGSAKSMIMLPIRRKTFLTP